MRFTQPLMAGSMTVGLGVAAGCASPVHMSPMVAPVAMEQAGREIRTAENWVPQILGDEDAERLTRLERARPQPQHGHRDGQ